MSRLEVITVFVLGSFLSANCTSFEVRSKITGGPCILLNIDATFYLTYKSQVANLFDLKGASVIFASSKCGNVFIGSTSVLSVKLFPSKEMLMFTFTRQNNNVNLSMRFMLDAKKHFQDMNSTLPVQLNDKHHLPIGTVSPNSYKCISEETVAFNPTNNFHLKMMITNLQIQAYDIRNSVFGPAIECNQDLATSTPQALTSVIPQNVTTTPVPEMSTTEHTPETTTEPPTNTTTEPVQTTTTSEPETTSHSGPETTSHLEPETTSYSGPETTSHSKPETTSHSELETSAHSEPETSTNPAPETTTKPISTSSKPQSTTERSCGHKYVVRDNKKVCIVLQGNITFEISYQKKGGGATKAMVAVPDDVNVSGNCSNSATSQEITLAFFNSTWMLNIVVAKGGKSNKQNAKLFQVLSDTVDYSWQYVSVTYKVDDHFPSASNAGDSITATAENTVGKFAAGVDGSFKCNAEQDLEFGENKMMKMDLSKMQYRAFGKTNSTDFSAADVSKCPADDHNRGGGSSHKTLGIAFGCTFAVLVIIVFMACGISRYRKRKRDNGRYDEMYEVGGPAASQCEVGGRRPSGWQRESGGRGSSGYFFEVGGRRPSGWRRESGGRGSSGYYFEVGGKRLAAKKF